MSVETIDKLVKLLSLIEEKDLYKNDLISKELDKYKYEIKIEDIVNALNNLELLVAEYFNLDKDEDDEGIDPENRHLGEPGLAPASSNENVTNEIGRKGASNESLIALVSALKDLLDQLNNPADVEDERITDPESIKDSSIIRDEEHPPSGDPRTSPEALEDLDKKESATLEHRDLLPGQNNDQNPSSLIHDEGNPEPDPINPEASNENDGPLQSSGEAYLSMPKDVIPEEENNEKEKAKDNETQNNDSNAEQGSKEETAKTEIIGEDDDDEEEGGVGGENNTPAQGGWFDSKSINNVAVKKGLDHYKANDDGYISSHGLVSFSNFGKASIEDYYPDDEELGEINANHSLVTMSKSDLIVLPIVAADTDIDRGGEHFTKGALESFVPLYKGKALLLDHNWTTDHEIGRIFDAKVIENKLVVKTYIPNNEFNKKLINNILSGVHARASVGFSMDIRNVTCDSCAFAHSAKKGPPTQGLLESSGYFGVSIFDEENCPHKPGALDEYGNKTTVTLHKVADVMELSFVPVPMQPKAGTNRNLSLNKGLNLDNNENTISSNIISSRTMGEKAVSDLTAPRGGNENEATVPAAAGPFDVEGNQTRPTDDNIFARSAIKNLHDISESLKTLTTELIASTAAFKTAIDEYKSVIEQKASDAESNDEEKEEKVKVLEEVAKTLTDVVKKQLETEQKTKEVETEVSSGSWLTELVNDFNKSLGG